MLVIGRILSEQETTVNIVSAGCLCARAAAMLTATPAANLGKADRWGHGRWRREGYPPGISPRNMEMFWSPKGVISSKMIPPGWRVSR